ncbi:cytochrome b5 [Hyphodiscus hymeniophilus]|uniref:Cytochrome b5 n=1 Tax=Hyphodiscus hymeniophilus TaxID=353542 RepID=A0A9P6VRA1_9HELO|nr:cytochrome b5 [Hyphodiscus hymeniophilus]
MSKSFSVADVSSHKDAASGMYIIVDENVYDVTTFVDEHPGGAKILKRVAGKDATKQFWKYHNESVLKKYSERLRIGSVKDKAKL